MDNQPQARSVSPNPQTLKMMSGITEHEDYMVIPDPDPGISKGGETSSSEQIWSQETDKRINVEGGNDEIDAVEKEEQELVYELNCPRVNCPEKIVICLDLSSAMDKMTFRSRAGDKFTPLKLIKRALDLFLQGKSRLDSRHQFALVILQDVAVWVSDFTNNPREIMNLLEDNDSTTECDTFDLTSLFKTLQENVELPVVAGDQSILPPPYIVRVLVIYGRSHCCPHFSDKEIQRVLETSPYFFVDAFYIHDPVSDENSCEETFNRLCDLDYKGLSYVFEASRNPTKLYDFMAQFLAHPLQRPLQKDAAYKIESVDE